MPPRKTLRPFVAIDGESVTFPDGEHRYVILAASNGGKMVDAAGLDTKKCLDFLLWLKRDVPDGIFVIFGLNYDVNMMLGDVPWAKIETLYREGEVRVSFSGQRYFLQWTQGKFFQVSSRGTTIRIADPWGMFQSSFVVALQKWNVAAPETIASMKARRSSFAVEDIPEMLSYCEAECQLLVQLMDEARAALYAVNLRPSSWHGAGAVAGALLRRENVLDHRPPEANYIPELRHRIMQAYYGGRVETFAVGNVGACVTVDIRSAYPSVAAMLPSLCGRWFKAREFDPTLFGIWRVRWNIPDAIICPFPYRMGKAIYYPTNGIGYYHTEEVEAALAVYPDDVTVEAGYVVIPDTPALPFAFLEAIYQQRERLKREGHASEKVLKLAINSVYGKLAQGVSKRGNPPYQSYLWAGAITAGTRARMLTLCATAPDAVVSIATDGIVFRQDERLSVLEDVPGLGGLELGQYQALFLAQPGIYVGVLADGSEYTRTRGFFHREVNWNDLRSAYDNDGIMGRSFTSGNRFVGVGSAVMLSDGATLWRHWHKAERKVSLYPQRKFPGDVHARYTSLVAPILDELTEPSAYVPKGKKRQDIDQDVLQGLEQSLRYYEGK